MDICVPVTVQTIAERTNLLESKVRMYLTKAIRPPYTPFQLYVRKLLTRDPETGLTTKEVEHFSPFKELETLPYEQAFQFLLDPTNFFPPLQP